MAVFPDPLFLQLKLGPLGCRFALHHRPAGPPRGLVVYVHPFAEEMNKSRRMAALQSRALAEAGFAVLQLDLMGCGDSDGELLDASWAQWVADVVFACGWLRQQYLPSGPDTVPLWLWGLRAGALLAADAARQWPEPQRHGVGPAVRVLLPQPAAGKDNIGHPLRPAGVQQLTVAVTAAHQVELQHRKAGLGQRP